MREGLFNLVRQRSSRYWLLGLENLVEIVVRNSDRNLSFTVRNPEFRGFSPTALCLELGFKSLYLNPTAHAQEHHAPRIVKIQVGGPLDATFS